MIIQMSKICIAIFLPPQKQGKYEYKSAAVFILLIFRRLIAVASSPALAATSIMGDSGKELIIEIPMEEGEPLGATPNDKLIVVKVQVRIFLLLKSAFV